MKHFSIIGAGPAGASLAILLARAGHKVELFEKRDVVGEASPHFPAISLLISPRGQKTLKKLGLWDKFLDNAYPMHGRLRHLLSGYSIFMLYGKKDWVNYAIDRNILTKVIFDEAKKTSGISIFIGHKLQNISDNLAFDNNGVEKTYTRGEYIIGADGANSQVRELMKAANSGMQISKQKFSHSYTQVILSAKLLPKKSLEAINIFPRKDHMMVGMPNSKETLNCTLIIPSGIAENKETFDDLLKVSFPDLYENVKSTNNIKDLKFADLYRIETNSYYNESTKTILIGDAAHTILPFMGQGVNLGLEDSLLLAELFLNEDEKSLPSFFEGRMREGLSAACLSADHYVAIINSSYQKSPTVLEKVKTILKSMFKPDTPLPVIMLDFNNASYKSLVKDEELTFEV